MMAARWNQRQVARELYMMVLSREPTQGELAAATEYCRTSGLKLNKAAVDLAWALINTKEFLYRH